MSSTADPRDASRRKALKVAVAALCSEVGFDKAEESVLETMTEMLQSFMCELGKSAHAYTELSGRTEALMTDVFMALVDMGINVQTIQGHARRKHNSVFLPPANTPAPAILKSLQAGDKQAHPSHIPDHLPPFPDPHTYIRSLTNKAPVTEYQIIREKAASQKRDIERALTRFIAKTGDTQSLFPDSDIYPLIAVKPNPRPYLDALLPKDDNLEDQEGSGSGGFKSGKTKMPGAGGDSVETDSIDNPYLRPVKLYRYRKKVK